MAIWNPWKGCHKLSEGCVNCFIHRSDENKGIDTNTIYKTDEFAKIIKKNKHGQYLIKSGEFVYVCFRGDFLIEEADPWRLEAWEMMKERSDLNFLFLTRRIDRFKVSLPSDYPKGYEHISVGISAENQKTADFRIPLLKSMPIAHKLIILQPMIESIDLSAYLDQSIEQVIVGGEQGSMARPLNKDWVVSIREQCIEKQVSFEYRQVGSHYLVDGELKKINQHMLCKVAREEQMDYTPEPAAY
ncbi:MULTISPECIES: DUF5131 family protein [unclassified Fusibacter]|uniref:DUF5131 family protein n=1 Tax=unclassified Fusibacter TaxID=2624464 RepID=UPI001010A24B|nr:MULTISPECIES: DUF5131 family protein [unclassified Fusibacter]MCK8058485.1 phage Gp37/Gp68 family protein [Fusibacter sp. A2]NPE22746.1 DUF5131 family protein [Fusibacter sp. A1]RXV60305.1 DUF5131 family protein [Fusibacter sp. A1]